MSARTDFRLNPPSHKTLHPEHVHGAGPQLSTKKRPPRTLRRAMKARSASPYRSSKERFVAHTRTCLPGVYPDRPSEERQAIPQTPIMNAPDALFPVSAFSAFWRKARNKMRHSFYDVSFPYKRYHDTLLIVTHDNARSFRMRLQQFDCTLFHKSKRGYAKRRLILNGSLSLGEVL